MRIALISGEYPPLQGGVGDYTRCLAQALNELNHEVHVLTLFVNGRSTLEREAGIYVHRLVSRWDWQTRRRVEGFDRLYRPEVINLQYQAAAYNMHPAINLLPGMLARRIPTVVTFHDLKVPYLFPKAGPLRWKSIVHMARSASACIVTNVEDYDTLRNEGVSALHLVPIGSNIAPAAMASFDREAWLQARGIPPSQTLMGYFGFLNESKGGETLIRALAELRRRGLDIGLLHIGGVTGDSDPTNAAYAARIDQLAHSLGVADVVYRTGFLEPSGVSEAFRACTCVALPYRDGASFRRGTLMAALVHGCAIVTTLPRVPIAELKHAQNALLVPPDDPIALADAVQRVVSDEALRHTLQQGAVALSALFRWDRIAQETLSVYAQATRR
ncbi:MAG: glycosyltransferase family 4 protein [Thermoflexales bacterium]|nr:glycosyltransferase family 4 protein [Thermoflexales bacterium]